jgi:hypothetical protein
MHELHVHSKHLRSQTYFCELVHVSTHFESVCSHVQAHKNKFGTLNVWSGHVIHAFQTLKCSNQTGNHEKKRCWSQTNMTSNCALRTNPDFQGKMQMYTTGPGKVTIFLCQNSPFIHTGLDETEVYMQGLARPPSSGLLTLQGLHHALAERKAFVSGSPPLYY